MPPANCCRIAMVIIPFSSPGPGSPSGQSWCCPLYRGAVSRCFATRWLGVADCCWRPASVSSPSPLHWRDLANVFAVFFIGPIISYILAAIFLKEAVTPPRSALLFLGFIGILLIARPGFGFSIGLACALFAGCTYGVFLTLSRLAAGQEEPKALLFSQMLIATILCTPMALIYWPQQLFASPDMLAISGGASMLGNMFLIFAYGLAPATRMAPFVYFQLVGALLLGWGVFGTLPDIWGLAGLALLMISGFGSALLRR